MESILFPFRYSRAAKNQLRVYEKFEDGGVNHKAVVKEYSRSSADQESLSSIECLICSKSQISTVNAFL